MERAEHDARRRVGGEREHAQARVVSGAGAERDRRDRGGARRNRLRCAQGQRKRSGCWIGQQQDQVCKIYHSFIGSNELYYKNLDPIL